MAIVVGLKQGNIIKKNEKSKNDNDDHDELCHSAILRSSTVFNVLRVMCDEEGR